MSAILDWTKARLSNSPDVPLVLVFGAIGGLLATTVQALLDSGGVLSGFKMPPMTVGQGAMFALLGAFAAGVSIYVFANSRLEDLKRLAFFALLCGLAFPAIFLQSVDHVAKQAVKQVDLAKDIASDSTKPAEVRAAATAAVTTDALKAAPADKVDPATRADISSGTADIVTTLRSEGSPEASAAANDILRAARRAGYTNLAVQAPPPQPPAPER